MFISRKKYSELSDKYDKLVQENGFLESTNELLRKKLNAFTEIDNHTPEDCKRGPWCAACAFHKVFHIPYTDEEVYLCGKKASCPNFVEMKGK